MFLLVPFFYNFALTAVSLAYSLRLSAAEEFIYMPIMHEVLQVYHFCLSRLDIRSSIS